MREAAIMPHVPSRRTCIMGQEIRAYERITDVRYRGWSANMMLRRAYRKADWQVRHRDDLGLIGSAKPW